MDKHFVYKTEGVCANKISFDLIDGVIRNAKISGGCIGNTQGIEKLAEGMKAEEVALRLKGIVCHGGHSCPGEFAKAIEKCLDIISGSTNEPPEV